MNALTHHLLEFKYRLCSRGGQIAAVTVVLLGVVAYQLRSDWKQNPATMPETQTPPPSGRQWKEEKALATQTNKHYRPLDLKKIVKPGPRIENQAPKSRKTGERESSAIAAQPPSTPIAEFQPLAPLIQAEHAVKEQTGSDNTSAAPPAPRLNLPAGVMLHCRLVQPVDSQDKGATVQATLAAPLVIAGRMRLNGGTRLTGELRREKNGRFHFGEQWTAQTSGGAGYEFKAVARQRDYQPATGFYGVEDGKPGITGRSIETEEKEKKRSLTRKFLGNILKASGELAKDRVNTAFGERLPHNARNILLEGATDTIEERLQGLQPPKTSDREKTYFIPAGEEFYLVTIRDKTGMPGQSRTGTGLETDALRDRIRRIYE